MSDCVNKKRVKIRLKTNEVREIYADCNKCIACQSKKKRANIKLFSKEFKNYKYCVFLTLTYEASNIQIIDFYERLEKDIYNLSRENKDFYKDFITKYNSINDYYYMILDTIHSYKARESDNFYEKKIIETERLQHNLLCNKYATLKYAHIVEYLNEIRKKKRTIERRKENKDKKIKIAYIGCGEYPSVTKNRGRPHYHVIFACDNEELLRESMRAWKYGNIAVERGENQFISEIETKLKYNLVEYSQLDNSHKLNCIITQENKEKDIERIMNYVYENKLRLDTKNRESTIAYTIAYTHKKLEAEAYSSNFNIAKELALYYKIKEQNKNYEYKDIRSEIKRIKKEYRENRRNINYIFDSKEEAFVFKSKNAAIDDFNENIDKYINEQLDYYYDKNNNYKSILIDDITHNRIIRRLQKETLKLEKELKDENINFERRQEINYELTHNEVYLKEKREYERYIKLRNSIINNIKLNEVEQMKANDLTFDYKIKRYKDNSIDIIDYDNKSFERTYKQEYNKQERLKLRNLMKQQKDFMTHKEYKSDMLIDKASEEITKHLSNTLKYNDLAYIQYCLDLV